jgi:hypothetical protein
MKPTLLILAAGMASRYGSQKQTEAFGPNGETIMDYSIYDAISAGFGKVVFIIRKDFAESFKEKFASKLIGKIEIDYVFQEKDRYVTCAVSEERVKPWGTGHAVLCAMDNINEPFAVINADDYYGRDAFVKAVEFLNNGCNENTFGIIGYQLDKTLSDHGTVSRGVCEVDEFKNLVSINERTKIFKKENKVYYEESGEIKEVSANSNVSMNFWCFHPSVFKLSEKLFELFLIKNKDELKAEFFIPIIADEFIKTANHEIKVIPTSAQWFGVTYKEDAPGVKANIDSLIENKIYPENLWN